MIDVRQKKGHSATASRIHKYPDRPSKRIMDLVTATALLLLTAPLWGVIALFILFDSPGPIVFRQRRVGQYEREFVLLKFRTMRQGTPNLSTEEMRRQGISPITRVGRFLRRTSLDELPQLLNVLRGEMSLVGPRPSLPSQTKLNALRREQGVDALRPGITGWAQINGRDDLADDAKVACDAYYLRHENFWFDLLLLFKTVAPVFTGRGNR